METSTEIEVKSDDIDELGHVNNSVYVKYLEQGRGDWYAKAGLSFEEMRAQDIGTVVLHLDILYKKEAVLGEILTVKTSPLKLGTKSFVVKQNIYNETGELITDATVTSVMWDAKTRSSIKVVEALVNQFK